MWIYKYIVPLIIYLALTAAGLAQVPVDSELYSALKTKDSILFDAAFNQCDPETMASLFTEDFEFYHDKGGATFGRDTFLARTRENCAKRNPEAPQASKRILLPNSLAVYALYKNGELYGAIQHGIHRFEFLNTQNEYQRGDTAKFTHLWIKDTSGWKIKRELSYDHQMHQ